jgi:CubicO group peptidase (beta-lactamase class C family)
MKLNDFADRYLFEPLGIEEFRWNVSPKGRAWIGGGARMIPREMLKIGQLMLNRGVWNGERILSEEWIDKSIVRQGNMLAGVDYGYLWQSSWAYFGKERMTAFWASGNGGQYIIVLPDAGMVVVFTGGNFNSSLAGQPFRMLTEYIVPAFMRPVPPDTVTLTDEQMNRLVGVYELEIDSTATSTITVSDGRIQLISPDAETIDLVAHSPTFFTATSQYGPLTVTFEESEQEIVSLTVYGAFGRFLCEKR